MGVFPDFTSTEIIMSFLTLTFLEIVLGVDNIIFISITSSRLAEEDKKKATNLGLLAAMVLRILLLFGLAFLTAMSKPIFEFHTDWIEGAFSVQSLILIIGGLFLIYKSVTEIHHKLEADDEKVTGKKTKMTLGQAIVQITLINLIFSLDSILTAVGMTNGLEGALWVMILAVIVSIMIMVLFAHPVGKFANAWIIIFDIDWIYVDCRRCSFISFYDCETRSGNCTKGLFVFCNSILSFSRILEYQNAKDIETSTTSWYQ